jgi:hypothetical protein
MIELSDLNDKQHMQLNKFTEQNYNSTEQIYIQMPASAGF